MWPAMNYPRVYTTLLCLSLVTCGPGGGGDTSGGTAGTSTGATGTDASTAGEGPTEAASTGTDGGMTLASTGTTAVVSSTSEAGETTIEPVTGTDTQSDEDTLAPTDSEPMVGPCDGLVAPDPANMFIDRIEVVHDLVDSRFVLSVDRYFDDNSWWLFFELGPDEPVVGALPGLEYVGETILGEAGGGAAGTATVEFLEVTDECVVGRITEVMETEDMMWIMEQLPGGFVATRRSV